MTPKKPKKRGADAEAAAKVKRVAALRKTAPSSNTAFALIEETFNPDRPLTEKQRAFVKAWAGGETILSASYRAGYADGGAMGYRLAKDPAILKIYNAEKALYEEASQMTRKKVMEGFLEAAEMAKIQADPTALTGAWREVGKMCGYYEPVRRTIDINLTGNVTMKALERASDDDLLKLIKGEIEDVTFRESEAENGG
jgi:hypothetical protein